MNIKYLTLTIFSFGLYVLGATYDQDATKRSYKDAEFYYEFHIDMTNEKIKYKEDRTYHWYRQNKIYKNTYGVGERVLHGTYQKQELKTLELVEKGSFTYGLKDGEWKNWYDNGTLQKVENWRNGQLEGKFATYNQKGERIIKGYYRKGQKDGIWIDYGKGDTLRYAKGQLLEKKKKKTLKHFFNKLFKKKETKKGDA